MFCPTCEAEYREGITHCPDCDVDLVDSLTQAGVGPEAESPSDSPPEELWCGKDTLQFRDVGTALAEAGIPFFFTPDAMRGFLVQVQHSDLGRALLVLSAVGLVEIDNRDMAEEATIAVWEGPDLRFAQELRDCFHENDISCRIVLPPITISLLVHPSDESQAREIIREIADATASPLSP